MPYSVICFLWRKPGTSPSEYKNYYETIHMPLLVSLFGSKFPLTHTRTYLQHTEDESSPVVVIGTPDDFTYDSISTMTFENKAASEAYHAHYLEPGVAAKIAEDEAKFVDIKRMQVVAVQEPLVTPRSTAQ